MYKYCFQLLCYFYLISQSVCEEIRFNEQSLLNTVDSRFLSVAIDSGVIRRHWGNFVPDSPTVQLLALALSPCYLRMGGTDADFLSFQPDNTNHLYGTSLSQSSNQNDSQYHKYSSSSILNENMDKNHVTTLHTQNITRDEPLRRSKRDIGFYGDEKKDLTNFTMSPEFFDEIHQFVTSVSWDLIFDLNVLLRTNDHWNPTNAMELMNYTIKKGYKMAGWELGNEPDNYKYLFGNYTLPPWKYVEDFKVFRKLVKSYPEFSGTFLLGPSVTQPVNKGIVYYKSFLQSGGGDVVTGATFHHYYINGRTATLDQFYDPTVLNSFGSELVTAVNITRTLGTKAPIWLGETSSAWGGGAPGISDRYVAGFMWLDKLGLAARFGVDVVVRQSFYGGHYALLDQHTLQPNPDYWLSLLYKTLVGQGVLNVTKPESSGTLRVYAHCTNTHRSAYPAGSVTLIVLNVGSSEVKVTLPGVPVTSTLHLYWLTPEEGSLTDQSVSLNGQPLRVENNKLPDLLIPQKTTAPVNIPALTFGFIVLPDVNLTICYS
ncbi:heparanase-like isoform X2 [Mya arenaria]|uniref:heparanase-like isoform X2 n=1 Tax=Mya arenaria TaxID=6604 RepID=UPI0022E165FC|nr:heparanase-like isoform X2 [Mya arenaria]